LEQYCLTNHQLNSSPYQELKKKGIEI